MSEPLRVLSLFAGIGGFDLGLERTGGFKTVAFCEIDPFAVRVLNKHWPEVPVYGDVRELTGEKLEADGIVPNVIAGGFPCQDISIAGRRAGLDAERSGLWSEMLRLVCEVRPSFVLVENVGDLLAGPGERPGAWFGKVLGDLASVGYDAEWDCIPAAAVGAPHLRDRVWVMAYPQQEQRVRPVFDADDASQITRRNAAEWMQDGLRSQVGTALRSIPGQWVDQPNPDGMADGVSDWAHRLAACGNAVVPQIPELIGRAILAAIADRSATAPRRETGVARKGESGGAGTAIAQGQVT